MIKNWFLQKNFSQNERIIIETAIMSNELETLRETEKAIQFKALSDYGTLTFWCPKSCILKDGEIDKTLINQSNGFEYNKKLLAYAKENGVKGVRNGMKTTTLIKKIKEAGLEVLERGC